MKTSSLDSLEPFKATPTSYKTMTALVVDNVDNIRMTVMAMLVDAGFKKVFHASTGIEALNILSVHKIDVVLSEWQLPKLDGIELLRKIRLDPKSTKLPFVMMSSTIEQTEVIRAIKNGVSEYVVKPFSAKILIERIKRAIEFPVKNTAALLKPAGKQQPKDKENLQVLVVDDEPANIQIISELLKSDYKVRATTDGESALNLCLGELPPDLILLDIMMPNMDGFEVIKRLKSHPKIQHITVMFISAMDQIKDVVEGLNLGAVDYITKPFSSEIVRARVNAQAAAIRSQKLMREQVDTLMEITRLKDEFDRIMKNDLKQPMEEIFKSLDFLERYPSDTAKVKQMSGSIRHSTARLYQMVDDMLTLAKIEEGTYQLNPQLFDMNAVILQVIESFQTTIKNKRLEVHFDVGKAGMVNGEEKLTVSIMTNLIKNALEAAPRGSAVKIDLEESVKYRMISISNMGAVPDEILDTFFDKYVSYGKRDGSGIGTYASKLMTEIQGGTIDFVSSEQKGTRLTVQLLK